LRKTERHNTERALQALGDAMRNRRIELELTQEEIAKIAKLHRTYVTDVENGLRNISFLTLLRLTEALQCCPSQILTEAESLDDWW